MKKIAAAHAAYVAAGYPGSADEFIENRVKGEIVRLTNGDLILVTSVTNAGFNGMQVIGKLVDDDGRVTNTLRMDFWR